MLAVARAAYRRAAQGRDKWRFALIALGVYQSANEVVPGSFDADLADEFVARVREDNNWDLVTNTLANPIGEPAAIADALERLAIWY